MTISTNHYSSTSVTAHSYLAIMAAPPCSTFSIARFIHSPDSPDGGPQILRYRKHIHGLDKLSPGDRRGLDVANKITLRTISLLSAAHAVGKKFILENPADRGDRKEPSLFISEQHGPIWQLPELQTRRSLRNAAAPPAPSLSVASVQTTRSTRHSCTRQDSLPYSTVGVRCAAITHLMPQMQEAH